MNNFKSARTLVRQILEETKFKRVPIEAGPDLAKRHPNAYILLTRYGGAGLVLDGVLANVGWQVRVIGLQNDYDYAETLADLIDTGFLNHKPSLVNGLWVPSIQQVGGAPSALMVDEAGRTHMVCSYYTEVETALVP